MSIKGHILTTHIPSLPLHDVLHVPNFPTNLLSISAITCTLNCVIIFFLFLCIFQDLHIRQWIDLKYENGSDIYELVPKTLSLGLLILFAHSTFFYLFCGIIVQDILIFQNFKNHYYAFLSLSLCVSHAN